MENCTSSLKKDSKYKKTTVYSYYLGAPQRHGLWKQTKNCSGHERQHYPESQKAAARGIDQHLVNAECKSVLRDSLQLEDLI